MGETIYSILEIIIFLVSHAVVGLYSSTLKFSKRSTKFVWVGWIFIQTTLMCCSEFLIKDLTVKFILGFFLPFLGQYIVFFLTTKGRVTHRLFVISTYSVFYCICAAFFAMIKTALIPIHPVLPLIVNLLIMATFDWLFIHHACKTFNAAANAITNGWGPMIAVNAVFFITIILSSVYPSKLVSFLDPTFILFAFLSISFIAVYPVIFSNINSLAEASSKKEVEMQNKLLLAQIEMENVQMAADRRARHDRRHHNLVMLEFANNNDIESVREYLSGLVKSESETLGDVRHCDNMTVNTVLTVYERRAHEKGIASMISATASSCLDVFPQDLVIVIANLYENAINAVSKLRSKNNVIRISIKESEKRLLIRIENPCKNNMTFDESLYGVGLHSVIATTEKYDGMYDFSVEGEIFTAKISLNLK